MMMMMTVTACFQLYYSHLWRALCIATYPG